MRAGWLVLAALGSACVERTTYAVPPDALPGVPLTISVEGPGAVATLPVIPPGDPCDGECVAEFPRDQAVMLVPQPTVGAVLKEWRGDCAGDGDCQVVMSAARAVTAVFVRLADVTLTVATVGTGAGRVTSAPVGLDCTTTCSAMFVANSMVTLTASAAAGSSFGGWSHPGCVTSAPCVVTLDQALTVSARFDLPAVNLQTIMSGAGSGQVTSDPAGVVCTTGTCNTPFPMGTVVTLTAAPSAGSQFSGWGGSCLASGTGPTCMMTLTMPRMVIANFAPSATDPAAR